MIRLLEHPEIDLEKLDLQKTNALSVACSSGHLDIVKRLVKMGANVKNTFEGKGLVQIAEENEKYDIAAYLKTLT